RDRQRQLPVQEQLGRTQEQESQNTCLTRDQSLRDISLHGSVLDENVGSVLSETQQNQDYGPASRSGTVASR
ncbi:hypothetical protein, partial [Roseomonas sp. SXEYE001]|uniref:hypothetical protein n=1 Tax=Roseomonas xinghualingensis TaxID=2986475 RepID=UPI0021F1291B